MQRRSCKQSLLRMNPTPVAASRQCLQLKVSQLKALRAAVLRRAVSW